VLYFGFAGLLSRIFAFLVLTSWFLIWSLLSQPVTQLSEALLSAGELKDEEIDLDTREIEPSPVLLAAIPPDAANTPSIPKPSPKSPAKVTKPPQPPSNPLDAAMFKQLFPETPKVAVKKSLAQMQAECNTKAPAASSAVSPIVTRRESQTGSESGLFRHIVTALYYIGLAYSIVIGLC